MLYGLGRHIPLDATVQYLQRTYGYSVESFGYSELRSS